MKHPTLEYDHTGDEGLMKALVLDQPDALRNLHERYQKMLYALIMQIVHDETDAEEVLQDVFLQLWQRADRYIAERGKPLGWLVTLARRRAIDRVRQRVAYCRATERYEQQCQSGITVHDHVRPGEQNVDSMDLRKYLESMLRRLPPLQKEAVECAFFRGMSQREIAARAHLPLGTVKTRIELGLRKLSAAICRTRQKIA